MSSANTLSPSTVNDRILRALILLMAALSASVLVLIAVFLLWQSAPMLNSAQLMEMAGSARWYPSKAAYGMLAMIIGSAAAAVFSVLLALPAGILLSVWSRFYAIDLAGQTLRKLMDLLAGVPSVIYGLWGLMVLVPMINRLALPGASLFAGAITLAMMILPLMFVSADDALAQVPKTQLRAAAALGLSRGGIIRRIVLPAALPGMIAGGILQLGRALGETMAVMMVSGNVVQVPSSLFDPMRTLTANIALEMAYATGLHRAALFASALALLMLSILLIRLARWVEHR